MPLQILSVACLTCEKILEEKDGVLSAIRVADNFYSLEKKPAYDFLVGILVVIKALPSNDDHVIAVEHRGPDGLGHEVARQNVRFDPPKPPLPSDTPAGITVAVRGQIVGGETLFGQHQTRVLLDGQLIATGYFTLVLHTPEQTTD
jgi:hypothetical protein